MSKLTQLTRVYSIANNFKCHCMVQLNLKIKRSSIIVSILRWEGSKWFINDVNYVPESFFRKRLLLTKQMDDYLKKCQWNEIIIMMNLFY